jgi:hypothetical protein
MEPECSLTYSQQAAQLLPYSNPDNPFRSFSYYFIKVPFNVRAYSCLDFPGGPFPSGLHTKNSVCLCTPPQDASCPSRFMDFHLIVLIICGREYNSSELLLRSFMPHLFCDLFCRFLNRFQRLVLENPKSMFFRQGEERSFTPAQTTGKINFFLYLTFVSR